MKRVRRRGRSPLGPPGAPGPPLAGPPAAGAGGPPPGSGSGCVVTIAVLSLRVRPAWPLLERQIVRVGDIAVHHGVAAAARRHAGAAGAVEKLHVLRDHLGRVALLAVLPVP